MINVTKTFLPKRAVFDAYVDEIWESGWLTNGGQFVLKLEQELKDYFDVKHLFLVNNGTIALQIALKAAGIEKGEVITTPFTYVATTSSIVWEGFEPVFVDIEPRSLTIDAAQIEAAITKRTRAILPVHVYGIPCDVERIEAIARKYHLKVIYDAAHAFGVQFKNRSVLKYGDISTLSFHATKLFHTIEGGAIVTDNDEIAHKISYMRNFGHETPTSFYDVGINGKMNEFSAAMGLSILGLVEVIIRKRKRLVEWYDRELLADTRVTRPTIPTHGYNYSYYPVVFESEMVLERVVTALAQKGIIPRRYFYPSLNSLNYVKHFTTPIADAVSERVLCLPLFPDLKKSDLQLICQIIRSQINSGD